MSLPGSRYFSFLYVTSLLKRRSRTFEGFEVKIFDSREAQEEQRQETKAEEDWAAMAVWVRRYRLAVRCLSEKT